MSAILAGPGNFGRTVPLPICQSLISGLPGPDNICIEREFTMKVTLKYSKPASQKWTAKGKTMDDLLKNLNKHGWWGRYRAQPSYSYKEKNGTVSGFTLKAKPIVIMPAWSDYSKATKDQKKSWDTMWKALKKHEDNHHVIFDTAAKAWKKAMDKAGDVDAKEAKSKWDAFIKDTQGKQDAYDKKTGHGEKEGVILKIV